MLVFISDIHFWAGGRTQVPRVEPLERFRRQLDLQHPHLGWLPR